MLRIDNDREYFNTVLGEYLTTQGIIYQSLYVDTPQQKGYAG